MKTRWMVLGCLMAVSTAAQAELIGQWTFNEGKGTTAADSSGKGYPVMLLSGAKFDESSEGGHALTLDGVAGKAEIADSMRYNLSSNLTIEVWVKPDGIPEGGQECRVFGKTYESYTLSFYSDERVWFYIGGGTNNTKGPVTKGAYNHVVATFDGKMMRLYISGQEADKKEFGGTIPESQALLGFGGALGHSKGGELTFSFKGSIDEARIYNHALTPAEVEQHYKQGPKK